MCGLVTVCRLAAGRLEVLEVETAVHVVHRVGHLVRVGHHAEHERPEAFMMISKYWHKKPVIDPSRETIPLKT